MTNDTPRAASGLIGSREVCEILQIHRSSLVRKIASGEIEPAGRLSNGFWLFDRDYIENVRRRREANPPRPGRKKGWTQPIGRSTCAAGK